ncbi:hypothetical protein [Umezawaea beigongshangensis]|uniref:hypothetical protein n=1 Tax=Umezawaea beigongshangensis TaxID=2780383 RepID=UPI0018F1E54F|nr:hypothetical protein [Umezawaea beigongshangensis]
MNTTARASAGSDSTSVAGRPVDEDVPHLVQAAGNAVETGPEVLLDGIDTAVRRSA